MSSKKFSRREFLRLSAVATAGVVSAACAAKTPQPTEAPAATATPKAAATPTPKPGATPVPPSKYNEAPMLADLVAKGELPPVDERLPKNPYICEVAEEIGNYGGTIRRGFNGVSDRTGPSKMMDRTMVWYDQNLTLRPRFCESWEVNDDASEWTFHLREGIKWSDGTEFTTDDFVWWFEHTELNTEIRSSPSSNWCTRDEKGKKVPMKVEASDKYTIKMLFAHPNPLFIHNVTRDRNFPLPVHHMKQYHMDFTEDKAALEAKVKEAGFDSWSTYFWEEKRHWYMDPDRPVLGPWRAKNKLSEEMFIMERNPYYFGVDAEGNQLPYVDHVHHRLFESNEVLSLRVTSGEVDFQGRHMSMTNYTLYKESEEMGDYKVFLGIQANHIAMQPNQTTKEPKLRDFFQDRRVRIAMSLAINRDELNELVFSGTLTPRQYSPLSMSPQYYPKLSNAYIEYDADEANRLLDEAGYDEKDADGFRLWKDGSGPVSFTIESSSSSGSSEEDAGEMVVRYLADVGIKATYKYVERSLYREHREANEIEAAWWGGDRTVVPLAPGAPIFLGEQQDRPWALAWALWRSDPTDPNAEEPPEGHWIREMWRIWDEEIAVEPDTDKQTQLFFKILDIWAEELPMIGVLGEAPAPVIVKNGFRNYLEGLPLDDTIADENWLQTETYFWDEPEKHTA